MTDLNQDCQVIEGNKNLKSAREKYSPANDISTDVIEALKAGNQDAYRMVYLQFVNPLINFMQQIIKSKEAAEDLTQEILAGVWEHREKINIHTSFKGYLFTIARHTVSNYFRDKRNANKVGLDGLSMETSSQSADDDLMLKETELLIKLAVNKMPKQRRTIFELSNSGLSNEAIAQKLGINKTSVEKQISYARRELKDVIRFYACILLMLS